MYPQNLNHLFQSKMSRGITEESIYYFVDRINSPYSLFMNNNGGYTYLQDFEYDLEIYLSSPLRLLEYLL